MKIIDLSETIELLRKDLQRTLEGSQRTPLRNFALLRETLHNTRQTGGAMLNPII